MIRVKRGKIARIRRNKILAFRKEKIVIRLDSSRFRVTQQKVIKFLNSLYRNRRQKRRDSKSLWIVRINQCVRLYGWKCQTWNYQQFMYRIRQKKCLLSRKLIAKLALLDTQFFSSYILTFNDIFIKIH